LHVNVGLVYGAITVRWVTQRLRPPVRVVGVGFMPWLHDVND
jgi:hypothetical protein